MRKEIRLKETEIVFMFLNVKRKFDAKFEIGRVIFIAIEISNAVYRRSHLLARTNERENAANRDKFGSKRSYRCRSAVIIFITVYNAADRYLRLPTVRRGLDFMFFS